MNRKPRKRGVFIVIIAFLAVAGGGVWAMYPAAKDKMEEVILEKALNDWVSRIRPGGRMCVITFHSIEDRIVKRVFRTMQNPCICPPKAPICTCGRVPVARVMGGGAIKPTAEELSRNSRAHSATLRVVQKL